MRQTRVYVRLSNLTAHAHPTSSSIASSARVARTGASSALFSPAKTILVAVLASLRLPNLLDFHPLPSRLSSSPPLHLSIIEKTSIAERSSRNSHIQVPDRDPIRLRARLPVRCLPRCAAPPTTASAPNHRARASHWAREGAKRWAEPRRAHNAPEHTTSEGG
jgi:hypothetical protein